MSRATRSRTRRRPLSGFKACRRCKLIVPDEVNQCPNCGSIEFSEEWRGLIIILNPEESCIAKELNITKPGMYAVEVS
ncbi:transcription elongation factor subunit Spt4 [Caldivirga sp. UBA161]|uniref:transcription elongation factor subunit Spt4 n=1 Tax=Caldivirga sp. UBA161 TaxID=1915569 RepID=UPI0025B87424|nr:transcription elongation factor subunit Spt4 [Caldivirga sp. UBA161]